MHIMSYTIIICAHSEYVQNSVVNDEWGGKHCITSSRFHFYTPIILYTLIYYIYILIIYTCRPRVSYMSAFNFFLSNLIPGLWLRNGCCRGCGYYSTHVYDTYISVIHTIHIILL